MASVTIGQVFGDTELKRQDLLMRLTRGYLLPQWRTLAIAIAGMVVVAITTGFTAFLIEPVINNLLNEDRSVLFQLAGIAMGLQLVKAGAMYLQTYLMAKITTEIVSKIQSELVASVYRTDLTRLTSIHSGQFLNQITGNVGLISKATTTTVTGLVRDLGTVIALVAVMFYQDWKLALIALLVVPILVLNVRQQSKVTTKVTKKNMAQAGIFTAILAENLDGTRVVKSFNQEDREIERADKNIAVRLKLSLQAAKAQASVVPISEAATGLGLAAIMIYAGMNTSFDLGKFASFLAATMLAYQPMRTIAKVIPTLSVGLAAANRVFNELDRESGEKDAPGAQPLPPTRGEITFDNLTFAYDRGTPAVRGVSETIQPGEAIGLVGRSGAGKSTLFNLLLRFYDPNEGTIKFDGHDIALATRRSVREAIALVTQEPFLFDDTIFANIAYGHPDASEEDVIAAAQAAAAHEFIKALPQGYQTSVKEGGGRLSGGQRQRIAIARAFLKNAPIILLDEPTSALDPESERQVAAALDNLMKDRTVLIIAHRRSTFEAVDRIFVLDQGRLVQSGRHDELIEKNGLYKELFGTDQLLA